MLSWAVFGCGPSRRIQPSPLRRSEPAGFRRTPRAGGVEVQRSRVSEHSFYNPPRLLYIILSREPGLIAMDGVIQQLFVRKHLGWSGLLGRKQLHWIAC